MTGERLSGVPKEVSQKRIRKQSIAKQNGSLVSGGTIDLGDNKVAPRFVDQVSKDENNLIQPRNTNTVALTESLIYEGFDEEFDQTQEVEDDKNATDFHLTDEVITEITAVENEVSRSPTTNYLQHIEQYPLLNPQQVQMLFSHIKQGTSMEEVRRDEEFLATINPEDKKEFETVMGDSQDAKQFVVNCNLRLVVWRVRKYKVRIGFTFLDLIQEGNLGLMRAVETFDPDKGRFSTYAGHWIRQSIDRALMDKSGLIRLPAHMQEKIGLMRKQAKEFLVLNGYRPQLEEVFDLLVTNGKLSQREADSVIKTLRSRVTGRAFSFEKQIGDEDSALKDLIQDKTADTQEEGIKLAEGDEKDELAKDIRTALETLDEDQKKVTELRFGLVDGSERTLDEVADQMGQQDKLEVFGIQEAALAKLRTNEKLLAHYWADDPPSFLYHHMSAERAAFALGLFDDGQSFISKAITELPMHLRVFFEAKVDADRRLAEMGVNRSYVLTREEDDYFFSVACIRIWENMATTFSREDIFDPELRKDIYGGSKWRVYFDPGVIRRMYEERKRNIQDPLDRRILSGFLGLDDGQDGLLNAAKVAEQIELPVDTVITRLHQSFRALERTHMPLNQLKLFDGEIKKLREEGLSYREIAKKLGVTLSQVKNAEVRLVQNGEVAREDKYAKRQARLKRRELQITRLRKLGLTNLEIAKKLKMSAGGVSRIVSGLIEIGDVISRLLSKEENQTEDKPVKRTEEEILAEVKPEVDATALEVSRLISTGNAALKEDSSLGDNTLEDIKNRVSQFRDMGITTRTLFLEIIRQCSSIEGFMQNVINLSDYANLLGVTRENMRQLYEKLSKNPLISLPPKQERARSATPRPGRAPQIKTQSQPDVKAEEDNLQLTEGDIHQITQLISKICAEESAGDKIKVHPDDEKELGKIIAVSNLNPETPDVKRNPLKLRQKLLEYVQDRKKVVEANMGNENALFVLGILADIDSEDQIDHILGITA